MSFILRTQLAPAVVAIQQSGAAARFRRHRCLVWIAGGESQTLEACRQLFPLKNSAPERGLWVGNHAPVQLQQVTNDDALRFLGTENDLIVINTHSGFDCDTLAALAGTLVAGQFLVLLTPAALDWPALDHPGKARVTVAGYTPIQESVFLQRLVKLLVQHTHTIPPSAATEPAVDIRLLNSADALKTDESLTSESTDPDLQTISPAASSEQRALIGELKSRLLKALKKKQPIVCVVTADRGRGKSATLGQLAAELLPEKMLVTAPGKRSAAVLLAHFRKSSDTRTDNTKDSRTQDSTSAASVDRDVLRGLRFSSPDSLIGEFPDVETPVAETQVPETQVPETPDLESQPEHANSSGHSRTTIVFIDEAAAIPLPVLDDIIDRFDAVVLATTVQGYEGAGRGFSLKFDACMKQKNRQSHWYTLNNPVRWNHDDPLEAFLSKSLLLSTGADIIETVAINTDDIVFRKVKKSELLENEILLTAIFSLLLQAHYQTKPMDLRHILDGENLQLMVIESAGTVIATALIALEGPITDRELRDGIMRKIRRPRGHLLSQLLAQNTLRVAALDLRIARIVRIAVHPSQQRNGFGSLLLSEIFRTFENDVDAFGAMYGMTNELDQFWLRSGFLNIHRGFRRNQSSGQYSVAVLKASTKPALELAARARRLHQQNLAYDSLFDCPQPAALSPKQLRVRLPEQVPEQVPGRVSGRVSGQPPEQVTEQPTGLDRTRAHQDDREIVEAYCEKRRSLFESRTSLRTLCQLWQSTHSFTDAKTIELIEYCVSRKIDAATLAPILAASGKTEAEAMFRSIMAQLLRHADQQTRT